MTITVQVRYYAILREQRGVSGEKVATGAATIRALYEELRARHRFGLEPDRVRAAVNDAFVSPDAPLHDGDEVVFIPPVAGG